jgi:iron complex transport system ATP-binding protein
VTAALTFENVSSAYGARRALSEVTAGFERGAVTGIVGPNGAGKTTLLRVALRLIATSSGAVQVLDKPLAGWSREALARAIAYLPQGADPHWPIQARQLVALGRLPHRSTLGRQTNDDRRAIDDALSRCDAHAFAARRMDELSAGERARVLFARALATRAPILLADEPAAYLDPSHQLRLMELLREEAAGGAAVVVTLHDLSLAARHCDSVLVLDNGRVAGEGEPQHSLSDQLLAQVFGISALRTPDPTGGRSALTPWRRL